jgi:predicted Holliday junction resolvase-like endonuclease
MVGGGPLSAYQGHFLVICSWSYAFSAMTPNGFAKDLVAFFKTARHLWGRCPDCNSVFRLSDVAISSSPEPPRDWLRNLKRQEAALSEREGNLGLREDDLNDREGELSDREWELRRGQRNLERDSKARVREILASKTEYRALIRAERKSAVQGSSATLLGALLERISPCFRKFGYDPRDMRSICNPIDYVLFDGITVERRVRKITFIEVKCGRSRLSTVQRSILQAVDAGRVDTEVWEIGDPNIPIAQQFSRKPRFELPPADGDE